MFCLNCSRSWVLICPPEARRCPPLAESLRFFVAASKSFGRFAEFESCLAEIPRRFLFRPFFEMKMCGFDLFSLEMIEATIPLILYLGFI